MEEELIIGGIDAEAETDEDEEDSEAARTRHQP